MSSSYYRNLISTVLDASYSEYWEEAVAEWDIVDCEEDESCGSFCICGKENIRYLYTIRNRKTGRILYPIGSSCITKFGRDDFDEEISIREGMFRLFRAVRNNDMIELSSQYFSRKLLLTLYEDGAFAPTPYNHFNGENDYNFMLNMFNKRDKFNITLAQQRKIRAIIGFSIKPYLQRKLKYKNNY